MRTPILALLLLAACGSDDPTSSPGAGAPDGGSPATNGPPDETPVVLPTGPNGNPDGKCPGPAPADVSTPTTVVGDGTPASCTGAAVAEAVAKAGIVTFACGPEPIVIAVPELRLKNDAGAKKDGGVTIDGGGKVTLDGQRAHRILYQNTCDQSLVWTTDHCNTQDTPHLVLQNIGFTRGKVAATAERKGGAALFIRGGTLKLHGVRFFDNEITELNQDFAGGAIYALDQAEPVTVTNSTFEGNKGCSGGALGSIGVSWTIANSIFARNATTGRGKNPGTPGGGLGGAIYNDGNTFTLSACGTRFENNTAEELGSGTIFMVSNDLSGDLVLTDSVLRGNENKGAVQTGHPSIYVHARDVRGQAGVTTPGTTFE